MRPQTTKPLQRDIGEFFALNLIYPNLCLTTLPKQFRFSDGHFRDNQLNAPLISHSTQEETKGINKTKSVQEGIRFPSKGPATSSSCGFLQEVASPSPDITNPSVAKFRYSVTFLFCFSFQDFTSCPSSPSSSGWCSTPPPPRTQPRTPECTSSSVTLRDLLWTYPARLRWSLQSPIPAWARRQKKSPMYVWPRVRPALPTENKSEATCSLIISVLYIEKGIQQVQFHRWTARQLIFLL